MQNKKELVAEYKSNENRTVASDNISERSQYVGKHQFQG